MPKSLLSWLYRTRSSPRDELKKRRCCLGDITILSTRSFAWSVSVALQLAGGSTILPLPLLTVYLPKSVLAYSSKFCSLVIPFEFLPQKLPQSPMLAA
jgi:hypothetical protein